MNPKAERALKNMTRLALRSQGQWGGTRHRAWKKWLRVWLMNDGNRTLSHA